MFWWILAALAAAYVLRALWKTHTGSAQVLARQAANMNWVVAGRVKDDSGYNNIRLTRDGMEAVISWKSRNVRLVKPQHPSPFADFLEIERWLAQPNNVYEQ